MPDNVPEPTYGVPQALGRLRVALDQAYQQASRELGLTAQQAELLCAALRPAAVGDLATALCCDRSNVTRLVDRAAAHDLVRRQHGRDRRVSMIELTPKGERLATRFIASLEAQTATLRASWSDRRQQQAVQLLDEISDALATVQSEPDHHGEASARGQPIRPSGRATGRTHT